MRLILFICISFMCNLLHAAAMPIMELHSMPAQVEISMKHHADHHQGMSEHEHSEKKTHCPEEHSYCCSMGALPIMLPLAVIPFYNDSYYLSLSPSPSIHQTDTLFRPPKSYPFFTR